MGGAMPSVVAPGPAAGVVRDGSATFAPSSFGAALTDFGANALGAHAAMRSERRRELEYRERFFRCTVHDHKLFDFDGRMVRPGPPSTQPYIGGALPSFYVPLAQRRPSDPYRLARVIVNAFTTLLFGHDRWPSFQVVGDPDTQDFAEALAKAAKLPTLMIRARNLGGSTGTVGLSWRFYKGKPRVLVHSGKNLVVNEWEDREQLIPAHVTELYQTQREEYDPRAKARVKVLYWHRRDWTQHADIAFKEVRVEPGKEPSWTIDEDNSFAHRDGFCHFVWIQNLPEDDGTDIDGQPDYAELYENMTSLDTLSSVTTRGTTLNCDPTTVIKADPELVNRAGMRKGSDNALAVGENGDAKYMELAGTSIQTALAVEERRRARALEAAQCVVPDPNEVAAGAVSNVALKTVYAPMLGKGDVLREQYGDGIVRLIDQMIASARRHMPNADDADAEPLTEEVVDDETQEPQTVEVAYYLDLPPRVVTEEVTDDDGQPTGEFTTSYVPRRPGAGGTLELVWGDYFKATADDTQKEGQALVTSAGGKPVISQRTAVERMANHLGLDPQEEWQRVVADKEAERAEHDAMFPGVGGSVSAPDELPEGAEPLDTPSPGAGADPSASVESKMADAKMIANAVEIVTAVAGGEMPRDSGIGLLTLLGLTADQAAAVMGSAGTAKPGAPAQPAEQPAAPAPPTAEPAPGDQQAGPPSPGKGPFEGPPPPLPDEEPVSDEESTALAAKMTLHGVDRCEHEAVNRCRLCGIERVRDFDEVDEATRRPRWKVVWRSIRKTAAAATG